MKLTTYDKYSTLQVTLHWLMVVLMLAVYATINLHELFPKGTEMRDTMKALHFVTGLSVLAMAVLRTLSRLGQGAPQPLAAPNAQRWLAGGVHAFLYLMMLAMPIAGSLALSFAGKPIVLGPIDIQPWTFLDKALSHQIKEVHETIGTLGYFVIGGHAAAALYHHYKVKDSTLRRMWY